MVQLKLNPDKTVVVLEESSSALGIGCRPRLTRVAFAPKSFVHSLGILLHLGLLLHEQIVIVARSAYFQLRLVWQPLPFPDKMGLTIITHALVESQLNYHNTLYMVLPLKTTKKLQMVQNVAACMLMGTARYQHGWCSSYYDGVTFAAGCFPSPIQCASYYLWSPIWPGARAFSVSHLYLKHGGWELGRRLSPLWHPVSGTLLWRSSRHHRIKPFQKAWKRFFLRGPLCVMF